MIIITAFEKFGRHHRNPTIDVLEKLDVSGVEKKVIPVTYQDAKHEAEKILKGNTEAVIAMGFAPSRAQISIEAVAINSINSCLPDNAGMRPAMKKLFPDGPMAYTSLQLASYVLQKLKDSNVPAYISYSAGTYVCNAFFYSLNYWKDQRKFNVPIIFVHIPPDEKMAVNSPKLSFVEQNTMVRAIEIIAATLRNENIKSFTW